MVDSSAVFDLLGSIDDFSRWEEEIAAMVFKAGRDMAGKLFCVLDEHLANARDKNALRSIGFRSRTLVTRFGEVRIERRLYRDKEGSYRFLLDEALGLSKRAQATPAVGLIAARLAAHVPFRVASDIISKLLPAGLSHQAIHAIVGKVGEAAIAKDEQAAEDLFKNGVLPEGDRKQTEALYLEADGATIALQREKKKKAEVKIAVAYSGKEKGKAKDKLVHLDVDAAESFWRGFTTKVVGAFDTSCLRSVFVGGDGASWIRGGTDHFPGAAFRLDRFHVVRAVKRVLGFGKRGAMVASAALKGNVSEACSHLELAKRGQKPEKIEKIDAVIGYLRSNADGLGEGPSLGTIESNVDKLIANRMKKRGMSWSLKGARRMAKLLELTFTGMLESIDIASAPVKVSLAAAAPLVIQKLGPDPGAWLFAQLPALNGPHAGRPWVKVLRGIVRGSEIRTSGIVPTKS